MLIFGFANTKQLNIIFACAKINSIVRLQKKKKIIDILTVKILLTEMFKGLISIFSYLTLSVKHDKKANY